MTTAFVDSSAYDALADADDASHASAQASVRLLAAARRRAEPGCVWWWVKRLARRRGG